MSRLRGIAVSLSILLAGCSASKPVTIARIELVHPMVPSELLICPDSPEIPAAHLQSQVAAYIAELWHAHAVCAAHLAAVRQVLAATMDPAHAAAGSSTR